MPDQPLSARIEVFRSGSFTPMQGEAIRYSAADLRAIADAYDPETAPAPIVVGHPGTDAPAFGWVESFDYDHAADRLYANLHQIEPRFADQVKAGRFKKVSMAYFRPDQPSNPVPGTWYPKHVGFLGAAAPAVAGLKNVSFADGGVAFEACFGDPGFEEVASLFRRLREWLIDFSGRDTADEAVPSWSIEWLQDYQPAPPVLTPVDPAYSAQPRMKPDPQKEPQMSANPENDAAFADREAAITAREAELAAREAELESQDNAAFAEALVTEGKLLPALKDKLIAILGNLGGARAQASVSFADSAEKLTPADALKALLTAQPEIVRFGAADIPDGVVDTSVSFAADGRAVDRSGLEVDARARAYMRDHPETPYLDAVKAVS